MPRIHKPGERVESWGDKLEQNQPVNQGEYRANYQRILEALNPRVGEVLLDIGCGSGLFLSVAVSLGLDSTGIEDTPEAAAISQKTAPRAKIVVGSEVELPFEDSHFDLVTSLNFTNYFPDPEEGLHEIHRVLKGGGRACILLPNGDFLSAPQEQRQPMTSNLAFSLKVWKRMLESAGLQIVAIQPNVSKSSQHPFRRLLSIVPRVLLYKIWRFMPLGWSDQFICYCYKD